MGRKELEWGSIGPGRRRVAELAGKLAVGPFGELEPFEREREPDELGSCLKREG